MKRLLMITLTLVSINAISQADSIIAPDSISSNIDIKPTNYIGVLDSLNFNDSNYSLIWSSNPSQGYYKQEYILDSTKLENYNELILIEAIKGKMSPKIAAQFKINELKELKKDNPVINWNVYENNNDVIIDFVITDKATQYEWNLYRYSVVKNSNGQKYLVLLAYSYRDTLYTNEDLKPFFNRILENRNLFIEELSAFKIPTLKIGD